MKKLLLILFSLFLITSAYAFPPVGGGYGKGSSPTFATITTTGTPERISGTNAYLDFSTAGSGYIQLGGSNNTNNENLIFNFESTANSIALTSSTGATGLDMGSISIQGSLVSNEASYQAGANIAQILGSNAVGIYVMEAVTGGASSIIDQSGNARHGSPSGFASTDILYSGRAYMPNFDGTNNLITIADADAWSFDGDGATDAAFSICSWVEVATSTPAGGNYLFSKGSWTAGSLAREYTMIFASATPQKPALYLFDESVPMGINRTADSNLTAAVQFICATYDGGGGATAANGIILYSNGEVIASTATNDATYVAMENSTTGAQIAGASGQTNRYYNKPVGLVAVANVALTNLQIRKMYYATKGYYGK